MFKKISLGIGAAAIAFGNMACSPSESNNLEAGSQLTSGVDNQAPLISCNLDQVTGNGLNPIGDQRVVSTIAASNSPFSANPSVGDTLQVNCLNTSDETSTQQLKFFLDTSYDELNPAFVEQSSANFDLPVARQNGTLMAIKVVDSDGLETVEKFNLVAACEFTDIATLDPQDITVENVGENMIKYSINVSSGSSQQNLLYKWDFNGDGVFDVPPNNGGQLWTDETTVQIYSIFAGSRTPTVVPWNTCAEEGTAYVVSGYDFDQMKMVTRDQDTHAQPENLYYVQADMKGLDDQGSTTSDLATNGDILITDSPEVKCSLKANSNGASFNIDAFYNYENHAPHGFGFRSNITGAVVNDRIEGVTSNQSNLPSDLAGATNLDVANMSSAKYVTDGAGDSVTTLTYAQSGGCELHLTIIFNTGVVPCAAGKTPTNPINFFGGQAFGEFYCGDMKTSGDSGSVQAQHGKFFCEFQKGQYCIGGGGGGGGVPPVLE